MLMKTKINNVIAATLIGVGVLLSNVVQAADFNLCAVANSNENDETTMD